MVQNPEDLLTLEGIKQKIDTHIETHYTIPQLAYDAAMSPSKLKPLFHQQYNKSIYAYLVEKRLAEAVNLLVNTNLPLKVIAKRSGFKFQANFTIFFRRHMGKSPGRFRRELG